MITAVDWMRYGFVVNWWRAGPGFRVLDRRVCPAGCPAGRSAGFGGQQKGPRKARGV